MADDIDVGMKCIKYMLFVANFMFVVSLKFKILNALFILTLIFVKIKKQFFFEDKTTIYSHVPGQINSLSLIYCYR